MLDKLDQEYIKKIIQESIKQALGSDDPNVFRKSSRKRQPQTKLQDKVNKGQDTLAERVELTKLKLQQKTLQSLDKVIGSRTRKGLQTAGKTAGNAIKGTAGFAKDVVTNTVNPQVTMGAYNAFMYSNPLTAIIAEGLNLTRGFGTIAKGIGKGASVLGKGVDWAYQKLRKKQTNKVLAAKLSLPMSLGSTREPLQDGGSGYITTNKNLTYGGNNYIVAKQAVFLGGKNFINVVGNFRNNSAMGQFSLPDKQSNVPIVNNSPNLLSSKGMRQIVDKNRQESVNMITMKKGLDGIYKATEASNKLLNLIKGRTILIAGAVLLGVAAIFSIANWLKNKKIPGLPKIPRATKHPSIQKIGKDYFENHFTKPTEGNFNELVENTKLSFLSGDKIVDKMNKNPDKFTGINELAGVSKSTRSDLVGAKNKYSFNTGSLTPILSPIDGSVSKLLPTKNNKFEIHLTNKAGEVIVFDNIIDPRITNSQTIKKNQLIGFANNDFNLYVGEKSSIGDTYLDEYNKQRGNNYEDTKSIESQISGPITTQRKNQLQKYINMADPTESNLITPESSQTTNVEPSLNIANKNEIKANDNVAASTTKFIKYADNEGNVKVQEVTKDGNNSITVDNPSPIVFGQQDLFDITAASNSIIALK